MLWVIASTSCGLPAQTNDAQLKHLAKGAATNPALSTRPSIVETYSAALVGAKLTTLGELRTRFSDREVQIASINSRLGVPTLLWTSRASTSSLGNEDATFEHIAALSEIYKLTPEALETIEIAAVHDTGRGAIVVKATQRIDGLSVYGSAITAVMTRDRRLIAMSGHLQPKATTSATLSRLVSDPATALETAVSDVASGEVRVLGRRIEPVLFATSASLEAAHHVYFEIAAVNESWSQAYSYVIADDGRILSRANRTFSDSFEYRVWADSTPPHRPLDSPQGDTSPNPLGAPGDTNAAYVPSVLVSMEGFNKNPSGSADPWLAADATTTTGNNVEAYADHVAPDGFGAGDLLPETTSLRRFDYTFDPTIDAVASDEQGNAATVQAFYTMNWLHDYFYDSGFDETAGNAQTENFGRGGQATDPLLVETQDTRGIERNNANMSVPPDGLSPRAQFFAFDIAEGPMRDSSVANVVIAHEWGHYMHIRLAMCEATLQCYAMSEGWGDFVSLMLMVREGDDLEGTYGVGSYVLDRPYFGIRRAPYSTRFDRNALTFRHMGANEPLPDSHPMQDGRSPENYEVHNAGEIWAMALTEVYFALLGDDRHSFDEAQRRMADYVVAGLMATPAEATVTEARDALLTVAAATDNADMLVMAKAFARRGLGSNAVSPDRSSFDLKGIVESFDVGASLEVATGLPQSEKECDSDGRWDAGESATFEVIVKNRGPQAISGTTISLSADSPAVRFPDGTEQTIAELPAFGDATVMVNVEIDPDLSSEESITLTATAKNAAALTAEVRGIRNVVINADDLAASSSGDDFESKIDVWKAESDSEERWLRRDLDEGSVWSVSQPAAPSDIRLSSPPLEVGDKNLILEFSHRYGFQGNDEFGFFEGGVLEVSSDGGSTWSALEIDGYTGTITDDFDPLSQRQAFVGLSAGYPSFVPVRTDLGTQFSGKTIAVRFRTSIEGFVGTLGWDINDVRFEGLNNTPFPSVGEDATSCGAAVSSNDGGGCGCQSGGPGGSSGVILIGLVMLAARFRRRRRLSLAS